MTIDLLPTCKPIACLGDSITFMAASRADRGYPVLLDEALFSRGFQAANWGVPGGGIGNAQSNYTTYLKNRGLWGLSILVGVNDIAAGVSASSILASITALVNEALGDGLAVILSTVLPWKGGGGWSAGYQTVTETLNVGIRALSGSDPSLRVIDGYAEFGSADDPQTLQIGMQEAVGDALHLGSLGGQKFARLVVSEVEALLVILGPPPVLWLPGTPTPVPEPTSATLFGRMAYVRQLKGLLPPGKIFDFQLEATLSKLLEGIADELTRVNARGGDLINEGDPRTATETLSDWERILGLPDERVLAIPGTTAGRRVAITAKYIAREGQNYAFFEGLSAACGYPLVSIEKFANAMLRVDGRVGDRLYGSAWAYAIRITVDPATAGALTHAEFERVIRHVTHAHIIVVFVYL